MLFAHLPVRPIDGDHGQFGIRKWMSCQVFMFGFVATMQVFVRNRVGFLVTRVMLGVAESGYTPGAMYTLSTWYKRRELARRMSIFFFGMFGGNALSPMLASGILRLDGVRGIRGWRWLFLRMNTLPFAVCPKLISSYSRGFLDHHRLVLTTLLPSREPADPSATCRIRPCALVQCRAENTARAA